VSAPPTLDSWTFETLTVQVDGAVLFTEIAAPPMNLADRRTVDRILVRYLSAWRLVTIAQIEGRVRGAGSELVLACDMRFAARETAIFGAAGFSSSLLAQGEFLVGELGTQQRGGHERLPRGRGAGGVPAGPRRRSDGAPARSSPALHPPAR
jgi:Enoyl-CoA hydratase/isomerase